MDDYDFIRCQRLPTALQGIPSSLSEFSSLNDTFRGHLRDLSRSLDTDPGPISITLARDQLYEECEDLLRISSHVDEIARKSKGGAALCVAALLREICRRNRADLDRISDSARCGSRSSPRNDSLDDDTERTRAVLDTIHNFMEQLEPQGKR